MIRVSKVLPGILTCILVLFQFPLISRHIIGSDFYYECQGDGRGGNTKRFNFHLDVYRDCSTTIQFNANAAFGIYTYSPQRGYRYVDQFNIGYGKVSRVRPDNNPCIIVPPNVCVETTYYDFTIDLPVISETYVIFYIQCCRNNTILNIPDPGVTGSTFFIEITPFAQQTCNKSPKFKEFPPIVICADYPLDLDHSAIDPEGDSLVYEFCPLLSGGGSGQQPGFPGGLGSCTSPTPDPRICPPPFTYLNSVSGFTYADPLGRDVLKLDRFTGRLTGNPKNLGQYVVGICVNEYRDGKLIGSLHRDFQFNVTICEQAVHAKIKSDTISLDGKSFGITFCGENSLNFTNESFTEQYIKDYYWEFKLKNNTGPVYTSTDRNALINFASPGQYKGVMIVNRNALICNDTAFIDLNIVPSDIKADFDFSFDKCNASPIKFNNLSSGSITPVKTILWDYGDGKTDVVKNPIHLFQKPGNFDIKLTVSDGKICKATKTKTLNYFPSPTLLDILPDKFRACAPATINFANLSIPVDSTYEIVWDFGDGGKANTVNAVHEYKKPGIYTIRLTLKAPSGCVTSETFPDFISIQNGPEADFQFDPKLPTTKDPSVSFTNLSKDAISYQWDFGDDAGSTTRNPIHIYKDTGDYVIMLTAHHENGCTDATTQKLRVGLNISYFLPNAFTPNNDGVNDEFYGVGSFTGMRDFELQIFNRWGELIFVTADPGQPWNGKKMNKGLLVPNGVYVCVVKYKNDHDEQQELKGFATVIR
ncbi:MAG: PKD domain-containing protein [Saprospiraceae bacterium]